MKYSPHDMYQICRKAFFLFHMDYTEFPPKTMTPFEEEDLWKKKYNCYIREPRANRVDQFILKTEEGMLINVTPYSFTIRAKAGELEYVQLLRVTEKEYPSFSFDEEWHEVLEKSFERIQEKNEQLDKKHKPDPELQKIAIEQILKNFHQSKLRREIR